MDTKKKVELTVSLYRVTYGVCGAIALLSLATVIAMTVVYMKLKLTKSPHHSTMRELRNALAVALNRPGLRRASAQQVADEIENLPNEIDLAQQNNEKWTKEYQSFFKETQRSSSGSWMLHGKSLYYFSKGEKRWHDAEAFCVSRDAHLASVLSDEEQDFITSQIARASWIGLTDGNQKGRWGWTDGSGLQKQYWSAGKPNDTQHARESKPSCTLVAPSSTIHNWNNDDCQKRYRWVCKSYLGLGKP